MKVILALLLLISTTALAKEVRFSVLQTSDIHSHFTSRESPMALGGLARLKTKINEVRGSVPHTLLLDAGDWSEGSIFFTLNSGEASERVLEQMGYDTIVLGNHDWLVGPKDMYKTFVDAQMNVPVVSANLDMSTLPPDIRLQDYIKPYIVKEFDGLRVGILGLSTFEFLYDDFAKPAKLKDPFRVAEQYVSLLRRQERCDVVIVLSHLGLTQDKVVARIPGIDLIVGGHNHLLMKEPIFIGNTPIMHIGKWGQYLGQLNFVFSDGKLSLENYQIHQIDAQIPEDPLIATMVDGYIHQIEQMFGKIFNDNVAQSLVDMQLENKSFETAFNNLNVDAMKEATGADLGLDNPMYTSRDLRRGQIDSVDLFNCLSHIWSREKQKVWTVKTFDIYGFHLRTIMASFFRMNFSISMAGATVVVDKTKKGDQVVDFKVNGHSINWFRKYRVAGTDGITIALETLKKLKVDVKIQNLYDTGLEPWRLMANKLKTLSPITREKIPWEGRLRYVQPDLMIRVEDVMIYPSEDPGFTLVEVIVRNAGKTTTAVGSLKGIFDPTPRDTLDSIEQDLEDGVSAKSVIALAPGQAQTIVFKWSTSGLAPGRYPLNFAVTGDASDNPSNNTIETFVDLP